MSVVPGALDLAGRVVWRPAVGALGGELRNERPDLVPRISTGRPAAQLPELMAALLSLCGPAHRLASQLAVAAAQGRPSALSSAATRQHQFDTIAEHVRRIWLDWPRWAALGGAVLPPPPALADGPALHASSAHPQPSQHMEAIRHWVAEQVLGMAPTLWLAGWQAEGEVWLHHWAHSAPTWPAQSMRAVREPAQALRTTCHPWWPDEPALSALADQLGRDPGCARQPTWPVASVETGPWCRLHDRAHLSRLNEHSVSAWWRLGGRLADLARLCLSDDTGEAHGRHALQHGSLPGPWEGSALSWIEMARGTLLHWVWLDGADQQATVRACQVIAPTEWNFHRDGPVARLLSTLSPGPWTQRDAALAVAAWDPCVPFVIDPADTSTDPVTEDAHA